MNYLGIDMGSTACKVVIINEDNKIVTKLVSPIWVDPINTIKDVFSKMNLESMPIIGIGVTGSARNLIAKCLKTDFTRSEIISHTYATLTKHPCVKTIIEIGGQDSKYINVEDNVISEFKMNSVCAAGTGSFLQWQAERMGISLEEFDELAMTADKELEINGRCTVFIESSVVNLQRRGEKRENVAYSICLCLARNYMNEFCKFGKINAPVAFQGGVAMLRGMRRAFESILGQNIIIDSECQLLGALGVAMLVKNQMSNSGLQFHNVGKTTFHVNDYKTESIYCKDCNRNCNLIRYVSILTGDSFIVGGRCGKY